jgi:hypothetical protein
MSFDLLPPEGDLIGVVEAAKMLGIAPQTLRNRMSQSRPCPPYFKHGRKVLFSKPEVQRFLMNHRFEIVPEEKPNAA